MSRVRALGWPVLVTGLAVLLGLVALTQPAWVYERRTAGGDVDRLTFGWTMVVEESWQNGVWSSTTWVPYTSPGFSDFSIQLAVANAYVAGVLALLSLLVLGFLQIVSRTRQLHPLILILTAVVALGVCAVAVLYPVFTIPPAAAVDINRSIVGFTGSAPGNGAQMYAWGGGAFWWLWIAAMVLALIGSIVPVVTQRPWVRPYPVH